MRSYSIYQAPILSFFSKPFYRDIGQNHRGVGALYLLLLIAALMVFDAFEFHERVSEFRRKEFPLYVDQMPAITITDGELSIDQPLPHVIYEPGTERPMVIFDTSGESASRGGAEAMFIVGKHSVTYRPSENDTRSFDFSGVESLTIDRAKLYKWGDFAERWLAVIAYPFVVATTFLARLVQALVYGAIGMFFAKLAGTELGYQTLVRLAVIALTPALIVDTIITLRGIDVPYWGSLHFLVALGYLYFGVKANALLPAEPFQINGNSPPTA